jgi:Flp pilus assembly protein TadD
MKKIFVLLAALCLAFVSCSARTDPGMSELRVFAERFQANDFTGALAELDRLLGSYPDSPKLFNNKMTVLLKTGDIAGAIAVGETLFSRDPDRAETASAIGMLKILSGDPEASKVWLDRAVSLYQARIADPDASKRLRSNAINCFIALSLSGDPASGEALLAAHASDLSEVETKVVSAVRDNPGEEACRILLGL